mmetsp:Transcript_144191/g.401755  ORF Transcript_144191/g.401755 Transcript_144191/m.401755 type:complete len:225 (+) Transcript_144191:233-907(+)
MAGLTTVLGLPHASKGLLRVGISLKDVLRSARAAPGQVATPKQRRLYARPSVLQWLPPTAIERLPARLGPDAFERLPARLPPHAVEGLPARVAPAAIKGLPARVAAAAVERLPARMASRWGSVTPPLLAASRPALRPHQRAAGGASDAVLQPLPWHRPAFRVGDPHLPATNPADHQAHCCRNEPNSLQADGALLRPASITAGVWRPRCACTGGGLDKVGGHTRS